MNSAFIPAVDLPTDDDQPAWHFAFRGDSLLVSFDEGAARLPLLADFSALGLDAVRRQYLGAYQGRRCYSVELAEGCDAPGGMSFENLRRLFARLDDELFAIAGRAVQIVNWDRTHQFCGRCGARTVPSQGERAKRCPECGLSSFPRLAPAVIVLIRRGREVLLSRSAHFPPGMYSVQAGFVEPGESLEETAEREILEEVGVRIEGLRYFGSQPWPFPNSLMIGFTADYAGGEIRIDPAEIEDAGWYEVGNLPAIPPRLSIARRMIDWFIGQHA